MALDLWPGIRILGTFGSPKVTTIYLVMAESIALIESGPSRVSSRIVDALKRAKIATDSVSYIAVSHIHLDHAGGAWKLVKNLQAARVLVYERGAKHLIDPKRLNESAKQTLGPVFDSWGEAGPIAQEKVVPMTDGQTIDLGGYRLTFVAAHGHAPHHACIYEEQTKTLFCGDALGIYYSEPFTLIPTSPPPSFDLKSCIQTIERLSRLSVKGICFPHYTYTEEVQSILRESKRRFVSWGKIIKEGLEADKKFSKIVNTVVSSFDDYVGALQDPVKGRNILLSVQGYLDYFTRASKG